jgi:type VI secretion system secreted protein VgrG
MPPYTLPDNKTQSGKKSRSSLQGTAETFNELRFEDKKDNEDVYFHAQKDFHRVVENDDNLQVDHDQAITIKNNRSRTVSEGNDTLTVTKGNRTQSIKQDDTLTVEGKQTLDVTGDRALTVKQGNETVTVSSGNRTITVQQGNQSTKVSMGSSTTEAMQSIELKVGQNSIVINQSGVTIKGMSVQIQGQMSASMQGLATDVKASAMLTVSGAIVTIN